MSERKDQELTIITKARDLVDETMSRTKKFDKRLRFTLSNRIDEKALDVLEAIVEANEINPAIETDPQRRAKLCMVRFDLQTSALTGCKMLLIFLDNYGSQVGKGTHFGLNRLRDFMREYYRKNGFSADGWVLKADVRHYFQSIRPDVLKKDVAKYLHDPDCLALACQIIDSTPDPLGIPIGNQSSQIFALLYLNQLDHLCKEQLRFRYYGRYMDDFYIICESKQRLQEALVVIRQHLAERGLELNQKTNIFPLRNGLDFLGFHTYIDDAGRVIRKVRKSSRDRMKRKLRKYAALYQRGEIDREKIAESYTSWRAHALHGDCRQLVAKYDQQFLSIFERRPEHVQEDQHSGRGC